MGTFLGAILHGAFYLAALGVGAFFFDRIPKWRLQYWTRRKEQALAEGRRLDAELARLREEHHGH